MHFYEVLQNKALSLFLFFKARHILLFHLFLPVLNLGFDALCGLFRYKKAVDRLFGFVLCGTFSLVFDRGHFAVKYAVCLILCFLNLEQQIQNNFCLRGGLLIPCKHFLPVIFKFKRFQSLRSYKRLAQYFCLRQLKFFLFALLKL